MTELWVEFSSSAYLTDTHLSRFTRIPQGISGELLRRIVSRSDHPTAMRTSREYVDLFRTSIFLVVIVQQIGSGQDKEVLLTALERFYRLDLIDKEQLRQMIDIRLRGSHHAVSNLVSALINTLHGLAYTRVSQDDPDLERPLLTWSEISQALVTVLVAELRTEAKAQYQEESAQREFLSAMVTQTTENIRRMALQSKSL
jgi:hypothetical protein